MGGPRKVKRSEHDYYPTPLDVVRLGMGKPKALCSELGIDFAPRWFLEPGSGPLAPFAQVAADVCTGPSSPALITVDLYAAEGLAVQPRRYHYREDFFSWTQKYGKHQFDFVATNPPYHLAEEFMRASAGWLLSDMGLGLFLLRLGFLESKRRIPLWRSGESRLLYVGVLAERPGFTGDGSTDQTSYGFYLFAKRGSAMDKLWLDKAGPRALLDWEI